MIQLRLPLLLLMAANKVSFNFMIPWHINCYNQKQTLPTYSCNNVYTCIEIVCDDKGIITASLYSCVMLCYSMLNYNRTVMMTTTDWR